MRHYKVSGKTDDFGNLIAELLLASQEATIKGILKKCAHCSQDCHPSDIKAYPQWGPRGGREDIDICDQCAEFSLKHGRWR
jgi:hypothetical protein